jgi:hypothetical protein
MTLDDLRACVTPAEIAKARGLDVKTVVNWIRVGVAVAGRGRVRLAAVKLGGKWVVPPGGLDAFLSAINPAAEPIPESPTKLARRGEAARKRLQELTGGGS